MKIEDYVKRVDELIHLAEGALSRKQPGGGGYRIESDAFTEFRSAGLSLVERIFGPEHSYFDEFSKKVHDVSEYYIRYGIGILRAVRSELTGGWLTTTRGLISAEVFSDFLDMGEHLLSENYKDPSAVMIGSVLEEHIRQLATKAAIPVTQLSHGKEIHRKADTLNSELAKANIYGLLDQKSVTSWLDLRNKAAHGNYAEYSSEQVSLLLAGVRNFIARNPL